MKKFMFLVFSVGLFLMGSQARADNASRFTFAVHATTISFSSASTLCHAGITWYHGVSFSTGIVNTDWLDVYDSSITYANVASIGTNAGRKKLTDWNSVAVVLSTTTDNSPIVAADKVRPFPIQMDKGLMVAPSVNTYGMITVYWSDPRE